MAVSNVISATNTVPASAAAYAETKPAYVEQSSAAEQGSIKFVTGASGNGSGGGEQTSIDKEAEQASSLTRADKSRVNAILDHANNKMKQSTRPTRCEFSYHEETSRITIKVIDKDTDEVVKEIPPEKTLEMLERIYELAGIMVDEKR